MMVTVDTQTSPDFSRSISSPRYAISKVSGAVPIAVANMNRPKGMRARPATMLTASVDTTGEIRAMITAPVP